MKSIKLPFLKNEENKKSLTPTPSHSVNSIVSERNLLKQNNDDFFTMEQENELTSMQNIDENESKSKSEMNLFKLSDKQLGILTLISGCIWHLYVGSNFMIGAIAPYIQSYYKESTQAQVNTLFSINIFCSMFGNFISSNLFKKQYGHPKLYILIGATIGIGGCYLSSFSSWNVFRYLFPASYGLAVGITFMPQQFLTWKYMPESVNMITGLFNTSFGFGAFMFTFIASNTVNPQNLEPNVINSQGQHLYPVEVSEQVPHMLRQISCIMCVIFIISFLLLPGFKQEQPVQETQLDEETISISLNSDDQSEKEPILSLKDIMKTGEFWKLYMMTTMSVVFGIFYLGSYKSYGTKYIHDEEFLSIVASVSAFAGVFRFIWSLMMMKYGFKFTYGILIIIQVIIAFTLPFVMESGLSDWIKSSVYMLDICLIQLTEGGHFVIYPVILSKIFGMDGGLLAYSVAFSFAGLASIINTLIQPLILEWIKIKGFCFLYGGCSLYALVLLILTFKEPKKQDNVNKQISVEKESKN